MTSASLVRIVLHVGAHAESRLNLVAQITQRIGWRMVGVDGVATDEWRHACYARADRHQLGLGLGDVEITTLGVLDVELRGAAVAGPDDAHVVPIEPISRRRRPWHASVANG